VVTEPGSAPTGIGQMLKAAREAHDLTQQDVSDSLNLLVRVIDDMETENWGRLPSAAFTRGYLRAYAKVLGIDADEMLQKFDAIAVQVEAQLVLQAVPRPRFSVGTLIQKQPGAVLSAAVVLVICGVIVVLWAVWPHAGDSTATAATVPAVAAPIGQPELAARAPQAANTQLREPVASWDETPVGPAATSATDTTNEARRISAEGDDRLDFVFAKDSWVEVKDRAGQRVFADLGRAGESLQLVGQAPFAIVLGNAPGVDLSFNGERVALSPHTRNNVATLALGQ
jgi:cytoskeleton protein RodZ